MPQPSNEIIPFEANFEVKDSNPEVRIPDGQLVQLIQQCEQENQEIMLSRQQVVEGKSKMVTKQIMSKKTNSRQIPIFHGCKIENITINIHK